MRIFGKIFGPLIMGAIFDSTCQHWTQSCGSNGSCISYNNSRLSRRVLAFLATAQVRYLSVLICTKILNCKLTFFAVLSIFLIWAWLWSLQGCWLAIHTYKKHYMSKILWYWYQLFVS